MEFKVAVRPLAEEELSGAGSGEVVRPPNRNLGGMVCPPNRNWGTGRRRQSLPL